MTNTLADYTHLAIFCISVLTLSGVLIWLSYLMERLEHKDPSEQRTPQRWVSFKPCDRCKGNGCDHCLHTGLIEDKE